MAGDLDFSVQLRLLNEKFNQGVNQARDKFTDYAQSVKRNVDQMNTDTQRASTMLSGLNNFSADRLTAEIRATADQLRQMGAGANLSGEQVETAMQASALQVTRLARQLEVARSEAQRLGNTPATSAQLAEAAAKVNTLGDSVAAARLKVEPLSQTNGTPAQIEAAKAKVDTLGASLDEARQKVTQMSQTRGTPSDIDSAKGKVDNLDSSLAEARAKVLALSQTNGTPEQIEQAKVKIDSLSSAVDEARLNVERLARTNGTPADIIDAKGRIDSVSSSLDAARLNVEQLSRTNGTPSDIAQAKAKVDLLGSSIDDAKLKVTELSRTVGTPADIAEAKNRVNDLGLSVDAAKQKVKELSQTKGTPEDIENAKIKITSLKDELGLAKDSVKLLRDSKASPEDIEEAQNKVKALTAYISGTQDEVKRLRETKGTPEDIAQAKTDFNNLKSSITEAKEQVKLLSQTRGTPEDIASAKAKVNELGDSLVNAKNEVKLLGQSNASPEDIAEAKAKVEALKATLGATRDEVRQLSQTSASPAEIAEARAKVAALSQDLSGARTEARQLNQTSGSPAELIEAKAKVNELKGGLSAARDEVKRLSETNASPAEIAEAKAKVAALKNELGEARTEARTLGQTNASPADIAQAQAEAQRLGIELDEARLAAERLNNTGASPQEIAEAAASINRLEQELNDARSASVSLANELSGAMNRASSTADNARNAIYRMTNIRVPETIRGEIDQISRSLVEFQNNSGRPAAEIDRVTRQAEEQIRWLERELNGLDDTQERVSQGAGGLGNNVNRLRGAFGGLQGLLAAAGLGIGVSEIIETADAFKTLEARIKLATGAGAAFVTGFDGVKELANETFSSVESTGELFAKISASAESMNLSQNQILSVTRTINEAIKLSGGSAASADAAIIQLIQGLQSGVVRGEEFNSIMEQAPRLAKAMADGLGVTRGELRAMAGDGKLTSEVVIGAVRDQGQAISDEFGTLSTTVGNSLQVVKNQIFNFVGEIDGSLNQTSKLAEAISYIGDNLEDLDPSFIAALTGAFENTIEAVVTVGKRIKETYDSITEVINLIAGGSEDAAEQIGLITASLHGVNVFVGAISDGIKGLVITGDLFTGVILEWAAATRFYASLTFGEGKKAILDLAEALDKGASEALDRAHQKAMEFESGTEKALLNAAEGAKERFTEMAADSEAAYNVMIAKGEATAEAIEGQLVKMVTDRIRANDMIVSDEDRLLLASKGLQAAISETGDISIESAKQVQAAYLGVGESFAEVALKAKESGKSIELSLTDAIHKANTKEAVDDILLSLQAMANQGLITGQQMEFGANIAKTRYEKLDKQLQQNIERFAEYANAELQKTNGATLADIQRAAALSVQATETGGILVMQADKSTLASKRTKEQIDELAGAVGIGLSKEFVKSSEGLDELISGFDDLKEAGYDAGGAVVGTLTEMTNKASNTTELDYVIEQWKVLGKEGKITGQELADGLDLSRTKLDELTDGINSVAEAYGVLGLKTREELAKQAGAFTESYDIIKKDGKATAQQLEESFEKTAKANIASNNGVVDAVTKRMAAERGVTVAVDEQGRVTFEKMGQTKTANDKVTTSVNNIRTAYDGISSSSGSAGNAMVRAANEASSAYDKLQAKIKAVKEAQAVAGGDEALKNLRIYGTEKAPAEGNQFGSKTGVENFLKSAGLSAERAAEEARKLYVKSGKDSGALNFGELQGYKDGQILTNADLGKFKTASMYLLEIAEKARTDESRRSKYEASLNQLPDSVLQAVSNLNRPQNYDTGNNTIGAKNYKVEFILGSKSVDVGVSESQAGMFERMMQELQDSKAIAGY
ncbi:tape measure protein [Psychrobacter sp.]|uniref:tape measure protein n=1 Tax=Psychrobacter sp. TaxID=56811 RepID=UPI003C73C143